MIPATTTPPANGKSLARKLLAFVGIDRAIGYTVLAYGWASAAGLVTLALIAHFLTPAEQGYYYTFGSLVALQIIFELGFSVVILQMASHEAAHLIFHADGRIEGPPTTQARLASILRKSVKWYGIASVLMACVLVPAGWRFFSLDRGQPVSWRLPWIAVVLASSMTFQIDPVFSFLEGCGFVAQVARTRLAQSIVGSLLAWGVLLLHHGLMAPALLISGQAIAGLFFIYRRRRLLLGIFRLSVGPLHIDWWQEVWPFQWRIAVSYACGFFIFQLFNPILFRYWGPTAAGRMGMSISVSNALAGIAIAWINTKAAPFGALIAKKQYLDLDRIFFRAATQSLALSLLGSIVLWSGCQLLSHYRVPFSQRLLAPLPFALLLLSMNVNQVVFSMAIYIRAHKQEKFLPLSLVSAVLIVLSGYFLGRKYGALGMTAGQFAVACIVGLGMGSYVFLKYRKIWHA